MPSASCWPPGECSSCTGDLERGAPTNCARAMGGLTLGVRHEARLRTRIEELEGPFSLFCPAEFRSVGEALRGRNHQPGGYRVDADSRMYQTVGFGIDH